MISRDIINKLIEAIQLEEDHTGRGIVTNDPRDAGGRTQWGLTEKDNPTEWADGKVTKEESAHAIETRYVDPFLGIADEHLFSQLVDFAVNAGPSAAVKTLQHVLGVGVDGTIGPQTLTAITSYPSGTLFGVIVPGNVRLNLAFRDARVLFYATLTKNRPANLAFLAGWLHRALEYT